VVKPHQLLFGGFLVCREQRVQVVLQVLMGRAELQVLMEQVVLQAQTELQVLTAQTELQV